MNSSLISATNWHSLVDNALTLAQANPEFDQAYQSIITPITKMAPGDSIDHLIQEVPLSSDATIGGLLAKIDADGVLRMSTNDVIALFSSQMDTVNQTISNSVARLAQMADTQADMLDYFNTPEPFAKASSVATSGLTNVIATIQSSVADFDALGSILSKADPKLAPLAKTVSTMGQDVTTIAKSVNAVTTATSLTGAFLGYLERSWCHNGHCRHFHRRRLVRWKWRCCCWQPADT